MKQIYFETKLLSTGSIKLIVTEGKFENLKIDNLNQGNIFLDQNMGNGPPGRTRSPYAFDRLTRTILSNMISMNYNYQLLIKTNSISHNS